MEQEIEQSVVTVCPTRAGHGFKLVVNGQWFYCKRSDLLQMAGGQRKACVFQTIDGA